MRRTVPLAIALIIGTLMITTYYLPWMNGFYQLVLVWTPVITGFAFFLAILSFLLHHWARFRRKAKGWGYNLLAIAAFFVILIPGMLPGLFPGAFADLFHSPPGRPQDSVLFTWLFNYGLVPMEATMFALLAFYIASAAFRAFRARNLEATLLLVAAALVMLGAVPLGEAWIPGISDAKQWIMEFPNTAAKRAIMIGVGLGMTATALKLMLGIDRTWVGRG